MFNLLWRKVCLFKKWQKESLKAKKMVEYNYRIITKGLSTSLPYQRHRQDLQRFSFPSHTDQSSRRGQGSEGTAQYSEWDLCAKLSSRLPQRFLLCHSNCLDKRQEIRGSTLIFINDCYMIYFEVIYCIWIITFRIEWCYQPCERIPRYDKLWVKKDP